MAASPEDAGAARTSLLLLSPMLPLHVIRIADSTSFLPKTSLETACAATSRDHSPVRALALGYVGCMSLLKGSGANSSLSRSTAPSPALPCQHRDADIYQGLSGPFTTCRWLSSCPSTPARWPVAPFHRG